MSIATVEPTNNQPAVRPAAPEKLVVHDASAAANLFDTARFEQCYRIAKAIAQASLIPEHLTHSGKGANKKELPFEMIVGNCFLIVNQAIRWQMDPFALPAETYVIGNKLGYQGKLVAAVINARAGLAAPLAAIYSKGKGDDLATVVFGSKRPIPDEAWPLLKKYAADEDGDTYTDLMSIGVLAIRLTVRQGKTDNQMWTKDPQQKLFYSGATKWARRHKPEIILGVLTDDDMERIQASEQGRTTVETLGQITDRLTSGTELSATIPEGNRDSGEDVIDPPAPDESHQGHAAEDTDQRPAEEGEAIDYAARFADCRRITDVTDLKSALKSTHPNDVAEIEHAAAARLAEIKANRGSNAS
jgi:hypothetical protein